MKRILDRIIIFGIIYLATSLVWGEVTYKMRYNPHTRKQDWITNSTSINDTYLQKDGSNANTNIDIGAYNLTTTGTIEGGTLTDGTLSISGGDISSAGEITATEFFSRSFTDSGGEESLTFSDTTMNLNGGGTNAISYRHDLNPKTLDIGSTNAILPTDTAIKSGVGDSILVEGATGAISIALGSDAGDDFNIDSGGFVYEGDNNRVGIGTDSPDTPLTIDGNGYAGIHIMDEDVSATGGMYLTGSSDNIGVVSAGTYWDTGEASWVATATEAENYEMKDGGIKFRLDKGLTPTQTHTSTDRFVFALDGDNNSKLGIGLGHTIAPSYAIHAQAEDGNGYITLYTKETDAIAGIALGDVDKQYQGQIQYDNSDDKMKFQANNTEILVLDGPNERVGIGTDSPTTALEVSGTITGTTLTDGTFSVTSGEITGASGSNSQWTNDEGYITAQTDDQTIDVLNLDGTTLQVSLEDDGEATQEVDLSSLQDGTGTDDQTAAEVSTNTANFDSNLSGDDDTVQKALETLDEIAGGGTDDQTLSEVLAEGTDANDLDITSIAKLEGVDVNTYIDMDGSDLIETKGNIAPSADSADNLGASDKYFANAYIDKIYMDADSTIEASNVDNWETAYGWGDWSGEGFISDITGESIFDLSDVSADPNADRLALWDDDPGTLSWVDPATYLDNTDDQTIDVLSFDGTDISISLEDDGEATKTLDISSVDTNTQLSQATVEDYAGGLWTGNTETRCSVTYEEGDNTLDIVVDDMNDDVPDAGDFGNATDLDANGAVAWGNLVAGELTNDSINNEDMNWADIDYLDDEGAVDIAAYEAVGTFESGDTFLVLEAGVGIREADYDDLPSGGGSGYWTDLTPNLEPNDDGDYIQLNDSGGTDYVQIGHDGTDLEFDCTNTTQIDIDVPITVGGTAQSTITEGLVVNDGSGGDADDDFRVETNAEENAFVVDASDDSVQLAVHLESTKSISRYGFFFAYATSEVAGGTTPFIIDCDTVVVEDSDYYSENAGTITIQKDGLYKIGYSVNFDIDASTRYWGWAMIYYEGSPLEYSKTASYGRETGTPGTTATNTIIISLNATDTIALYGDTTSANMDVGGALTNPATLWMEYIRDDS